MRGLPRTRVLTSPLPQKPTVSTGEQGSDQKYLSLNSISKRAGQRLERMLPRPIGFNWHRTKFPEGTERKIRGRIAQDESTHFFHPPEADGLDRRAGFSPKVSITKQQFQGYVRVEVGVLGDGEVVHLSEFDHLHSSTYVARHMLLSVRCRSQRKRRRRTGGLEEW